jgi:predicted transcriptional regulator
MSAVTPKEKALEAVEGLPADATLEDAMERLYFLYKVERGLAEADAGEIFTHEQAKAERERWRG